MEVYPPLSQKNSVQFVWRWGREKSIENLNNEIVGYKTSSGEYRIVQKMRTDKKLIRSLISGKEYASRRGTAEVESLLGGKYFSFPKPLELLRNFIMAGMKDDDLMLDIFAGSSTSAESVMRLNSDDGGSRKFIMIQISEEITGDSKFKNIAELSRERIRRAGQKILSGDCHPDWNRDVGFRVLKVDSSNMKNIYYRPDELSQGDLLEAVDNVKPDRTPEDLLFQVLVDWGVDLTLPIRRESLHGKTVFFVDDNALVACFDTDITEELVKELAKHEPLRVVFRDNGFASDAVKINVEQIFRQLSPSTEVRSL